MGFSHASPGPLTCELFTIHSTREYCSCFTSVSFGVTMHCVCAPVQIGRSELQQGTGASFKLKFHHFQWVKSLFQL